MSYLETSGTHCCGVFSIGRIKSEQLALENEYREDPEAYHEKHKDALSESFHNFYYKTIYPTSQPQGRSEAFAFSYILRRLFDDKDTGFTDAHKRMVFTTLNDQQFKDEGNDWKGILEKYHFHPLESFKNPLGMQCHMFVRHPNHLE